MDLPLQTYRAIWMTAVLGVLGTIIGLLAFSNLHNDYLRQSQLFTLSLNAGALIVLALHRRPPRMAVSNIVFLAMLVPTVVMVWLIDDGRAAQGLRWVPYEPTKLSALTLALMSPPTWWVGVAAILMFIGSGLLHYTLMFEGLRERMASAEPYGLIAYGVFALVLLVFRQRRRALQAALAYERADRLALERVADVALALRDLANTPTQTMELIRYELSLHDVRTAALADHMRRALDQLGRLGDLLSRYADRVTWNKRLTSFDGTTEASALLQDRPPGEVRHVKRRGA